MSFNRVIIQVNGGKRFNVPFYIPTTNTLWVFINGIKQICDVDYKEIDNNAILFLSDSVDIRGTMEILITE